MLELSPPPAIEISDDTDMVLNKQEIDWVQGEVSRVHTEIARVRDEITKAIAEVNSSIEKLRPHGGFRRFVFWLRAWGIVGAIITGTITLLAITLGSLYQAYSHVERETEFRTRTDVRLDSIESRLDDIEAALRQMRASQSPREVLNEISKLDKPRFQKALPALQTVLDQPLSKVNPSRPVLTDAAGAPCPLQPAGGLLLHSGHVGGR